MKDFLICVRDDGAVYSEFRVWGHRSKRDEKRFAKFVKGHEWSWAHWLYAGRPQGGHDVGRFASKFKEMSDALKRDLDTVMGIDTHKSSEGTKKL